MVKTTEPTRRRARRPRATAALAVALVATAGAQGATGGWHHIQHPALEGRGGLAFVADVVPIGAGRPWLLGGWTVDTDGLRTPTVWSSANGIAWTSRALPPTAAAERRDAVMFVARRGPTEIALGEQFDRIVRNAGWVARDGTWRTLRDTADPLLAFDGRVTAAAAGPDRFLAVAASQQTGLSRVRVFSSTDGTSWKVHSDIPLPNGYLFKPLGMAVSDARIVVVGATRAARGNGIDDGAIWTWADGAWVRVDPAAAGLAEPGRDSVGAVAYRRGLGFVAGGVATRGGAEVPVGWVSPDGVTWSRLPAKAFTFPSTGGAIHEISATSSGFVASGNSSSGILVWRSPTGHRWTALDTPKAAHPGGESIQLGATAKEMIVAVLRNGGSKVYRRGGSATWSVVSRPPAFPASSPVPAELRGVAVAGRRLVAVGSDARGKPLVMLSRNGRSWTRGTFRDRTARLNAVAANGKDIVVVGWRLVRGTPRATLWTSVDGHAWHRIGGTVYAPLGAFVDVAADPRGFSAVAFEGSGRGGLVTSVWSGRRGVWGGGRILGDGEATAICVGPHGTTAVALRDGKTGKQVVAWQRGRTGGWSRDADVVAGGSSEATGCEDAAFGTVLVGSDERGASTMWIRSRPGEQWDKTVLAVTNPPSQLFDASRDGRAVLVTGETGGRGQLDLHVWRTDGRSGASIGGGDPEFVAPGAQGGLGIVRFGQSIVVVGRSGAGDAAIWVGSDALPVGPPPNGLG